MTRLDDTQNDPTFEADKLTARAAMAERRALRRKGKLSTGERAAARLVTGVLPDGAWSLDVDALRDLSRVEIEGIELTRACEAGEAQVYVIRRWLLKDFFAVSKRLPDITAELRWCGSVGTILRLRWRGGRGGLDLRSGVPVPDYDRNLSPGDIRRSRIARFIVSPNSNSDSVAA